MRQLTILTLSCLLSLSSVAQTVKDRPVYVGASYLYGEAQGKFKANDYEGGGLDINQIGEDEDNANFYYGNAKQANGIKVFSLFPMNSKLYVGGEFSYLHYTMFSSLIRTQAYSLFDTDDYFTHSYIDTDKRLNIYKLGAAVSYRFDVKAVELQPSLVVGIMGVHVPENMMTLSRKMRNNNYRDVVHVKPAKGMYVGYYGSLSMRVNRRLTRFMNATMAITHDLGFANVGYKATTVDYMGNSTESAPVSYRQNVQSIHFDIGLSFCIGGGSKGEQE